MNGLETPVCPYHIGITLDQSGRYRVHGDCYPMQNMLHEEWFVLPPWMTGCLPDAQYSPIEILYPYPGEEIFIPLNASGEKEKIVAEAAHVNPTLSRIPQD